MPAVLSNQLKAMLVLDDISEDGVTVWQDNCFTVQQFTYQCERRRNQSGVPYGPTLPAFLDFTVRVASGESGKVFYSRMNSREPFPYSFLFNASFNDMRRLANCEDSMVVKGYIIDVEEVFDEHMLIHGKLLLCNLAYLGQERTLKLIITND